MTATGETITIPPNTPLPPGLLEGVPGTVTVNEHAKTTAAQRRLIERVAMRYVFEGEGQAVRTDGKRVRAAKVPPLTARQVRGLKRFRRRGR